MYFWPTSSDNIHDTPSSKAKQRLCAFTFLWTSKQYCLFNREVCRLMWQGDLKLGSFYLENIHTLFGSLPITIRFSEGYLHGFSILQCLFKSIRISAVFMNVFPTLTQILSHLFTVLMRKSTHKDGLHDCYLNTKICNTAN